MQQVVVKPRAVAYLVPCPKLATHGYVLYKGLDAS